MLLFLAVLNASFISYLLDVYVSVTSGKMLKMKAGNFLCIKGRTVFAKLFFVIWLLYSSIRALILQQQI